MSKLTRICSLALCLLALSSAAIMAMHPAASDAQTLSLSISDAKPKPKPLTLSISEAEALAVPRVGELIVKKLWPWESNPYTTTWGKHKRHSERRVEIRVILTKKPEMPTKSCKESGETEGPFCEEEQKKPTKECFRINVIRATKQERKEHKAYLDKTGKFLVGDAAKIDCEPKKKPKPAADQPRPRGR